MKAKILVLFNHKGGVSKTTTTYNIGWKLTQRGKRVLLVDGDPQCNLTSLILGKKFDRYYTNADTCKENIKDAVAVAFGGKPEPIKAVNCFSPKTNPSLFLLPGHMNLSEWDPSLSLALNSNNAITTLQNLPGAFYEMIRLSAQKHDIDYVLIDMNPGLSAINQTLFMSADAFIVPTNPDPFSVMALKTLKIVLPRWKKWATSSRELFSDAAYPLPDAEMKFIGVIVQRFNLRNQKAARPYTNKIQEIKEYVENDFVPELRKHNMVFDISTLIGQGVTEDYCIAEISDFGALLQKSTTAQVPVYALTEKQISETGPILKQMIKSKDRFNGIFEHISDIVMGIFE